MDSTNHYYFKRVEDRRAVIHRILQEIILFCGRPWPFRSVGFAHRPYTATLDERGQTFCFFTEEFHCFVGCEWRFQQGQFVGSL